MPRGFLYLLALLGAAKAIALIGIATAIAGGVAAVADGHTEIGNSAIGNSAAGHADWAGIIALGAASALGRALVAWAQRVVSARALLGSKERMRAALADRALQPGTAPASVATLATQGLDELEKYYTVYLPALVTAATVPVIIGARILFADWVSALIIVLTVPLIPVFMTLIGMHTQERVAAATTALARLSDHLVELARGLPVLVGLGRAEEQTDALREISDRHRRATVQTLRTAFLSSLALELIATISVAIVAVFIGVRLVGGDLTLEVGLLVLILAPECMAPFREIGVAFHAARDGREALARAQAIIDEPVEESIVFDGDADLCVTDLRVRFADRQTDAVAGLSFAARRGAITLLDGRSGTGKSTVLAVLAGRLRSGASAEVGGRVEGLDATRVAWLPQHPRTTGDTVLKELAIYGGDESLLQRLGIAHSADLPPALMSPGELRRLGVARVIARVDAGARLVLLDEPTAQLDSASAAQVLREIARLRGKATVLLASHDPAARALADARVRLDAGAAFEAAPMSSSVVAEPLPARLVEPFGEPEHPWRELAALLRPVRGKIAGAVALGTLATLFAIALTGVSGWLIVRASEHPPIMYLLVAIVGVRFFGVGRAVLRYSERLLSHDAVFAALTGVRMRLWSALSARGLRGRDSVTAGGTLDRLVREVDELRDLAIRVVLPLASGVLSLLVTLVALGVLVPAVVPVLIMLGLFAGIVAPLVALAADRRAARGLQSLRSTVLVRFAAMLGAADDLRANGVDAGVRAELAALDGRASAAARRGAGALGLGGAVVIASCALAAVLLVPFAVLQQPDIQPGLVAVLALVPLALIEPTLELVGAVQLLPALRRVLGRVSRTTAVEREAPGTPVDDRRIESIELRQVATGWQPTQTVLTDASARVTRGDWLTITGPSGSGKSTLIALLLGHLEPTSGAYLINGDDVSGRDLSPLARRFGWSPQEGHLFDSTIRGNLLIARPRESAPDEAELITVLRRVGLGPLLDRLTDGLDTRIGAGGAQLSGGERQRLAVARTLLTGADVILLDEPTAHLDEESARELMTDLRIALADRITVLVTHQLVDQRPADQRIVLGAAPVLPTAQFESSVSGPA
ncbi:thiol reductant ABC exporter subunit CydC [Lacisediminihabitans sp. G11-30]|uniref:Thiol reductant ABC exporter subunit CydC n=2 Tax=Lacisediminihabitans changchengi TaxID=2787634 RepID=A0A934SK59_9MICO|nr:thiol reductant ABC exporter subunit CydC [Lacisediminihabitans changchengi]MBK4348038.1 thiol reductant ABC exporter subunit CydC [Lacisediminihabitans changchengi]